MSIKYVLLLLLLVFIIPIIPYAHGQSRKNMALYVVSNLISDSINHQGTDSTSSTVPGKTGLIENNPGYAKYIPNASTSFNNTANNIGLAANYALIKRYELFLGINHLSNNISASTVPGKTGLIENNPGYAKYIPNAGSLSNIHRQK